MRIHLLLAVVLAVAVPKANAQRYVVRSKEHSAAGTSVNVLEAATTHTSMIISLSGKVLKEEKKVEIEERRYVQRILESARDGPTRFFYSFGKAVKGSRDAPVAESYAGKTLLFERKNGAFHVTAEDADVDQTDLDRFTKRANRPKVGQAMYSDEPVKVGESWKIGREAVKLLVDGATDDGTDTVTATGKLIQAYKRGEDQWGTIEFVAQGPTNKLGPISLTNPIEFSTRITLDTAIDASSTETKMSGYVAFKGRSQINANSMTFLLDIDVRVDVRQEQSTEK